MFDTIEQLASAQSAEGVAHVLVAAGAEYDVAYASHRVVNADGSTSGVSTMPDCWISHYRSAGYDKLDPGAKRARSFVGVGGDSFEKPKPGEEWSPAVIQMNQEIRQLHAMGSFFVAQATPQPGVTSMVNFITDASGENYQRWIAECGPRLRVLAAAAHARLTELRGLDVGEVALSDREKAALRWLAEGHRVDRIAEKMGVSNRTVEVHLANARKRVGAKTREQALVIAIRSGLFEN